jgi:3-hydroxybutyrate dehydrogenase
MFSGKSAIVTGSTSGIGLSIARKLAADGANVMLNGFGDTTEIENLRGEIANGHNVKVLYNPADMTKPKEIEDMVSQAESEFGNVDIVVNNAGIQFVAPVEDFPVEKWDAIIAINLSSAFHTTRAVVPVMKKKGWGRIVNIASAHALVASPFKSAYVSAKHGIAGLTKTVALEVAEHGITVNAVCPGYVEKQIPEQAKARGITEQQVISDVLLAAQPTKKFVTVEELSDVVSFLCTDSAKSITGAMLPVDGGWTAH